MRKIWYNANCNTQLAVFLHGLIFLILCVLRASAVKFLTVPIFPRGESYMKTNRLAIASFVLGLLGFLLIPCAPLFIGFMLAASGRNNSIELQNSAFMNSLAPILVLISFVASILSIIFGILALIFIKRQHGKLKGKGISIAGLIFGFLVLVVLFPLYFSLIRFLF